MGNKNYEEIKHKNKLIAIILRKNFTSKKTIFFGSPSFSQQLGYIVYKKGGIIKAHLHREVPREITLTQEVLFIKKGKLIVNLYTTNKKFITSRKLNEGDIIFLCSGAHGFKILEDTEIIEVKQGPYLGKEADKEIFEGVENDDTGKRAFNQ
jgi:quercetin dioxygenase-like cupin family protein